MILLVSGATSTLRGIPLEAPVINAVLGLFFIGDVDCVW